MDQPILDIFIDSVFFDGQRISALHFGNGGVAQSLFNSNITNCTFIGQDNSNNAIQIDPTGDTPPVVGLNINNCNFLAYVQKPLLLRSGMGVNISNCDIRDYNVKEFYNSDSFNGSAIYIGDDAKDFLVNGISVGGGNMYEPVGANNKCAYGVTVQDLAINTGIRISNVANRGVTHWILPYESQVDWALGSVSPLTNGASQTFTGIALQGAALGDFVIVSPPFNIAGAKVNGYVTAANTIAIRIENSTGSSITMTTGTWRIRVVKPY